MASPVSPWPGYPNIPIFLDTRTYYGPNKSQRSTATTFETSESISPVSPPQAPQCITVTPPKGTDNNTLQIPNGNSLQSSTEKHAPSQGQQSPVRHLSPVEYPSVNKLSESWSTRSQKVRTPKARGVRGPSSGSPFYYPFPQKTEYRALGTEGATPSGLGIMDGSTYVLSTSASPPYSEKPLPARPLQEKVGYSPNIAQRIEDRLWNYSIHGNIFKKWLLEIISWSISALCMATILTVLLVLEDRPLSTWPLTSSFSLNTFIATIARIASAALLLPVSEALGQLKWSWFFQGTSKKMWDFEIFDNASRGPWGSLQLLVRTKGRKLASLGAAIILLALALDPFFQQVLETPTRFTLKGRGSAPFITHYEPEYADVVENGEPIAFPDKVLGTLADRFFFENGTQSVPFGNGTRAEVPVSCPTSNCTWEPYETLGFCSTCADISQFLSFACLETRIDWIQGLEGIGAEKTYPNGSVCGYFLNATSENPILMSGYSVDRHQSFSGEALLMRTLPLVTPRFKKPLYGSGSINFKNRRNPIFDVLLVGAADGTAVSVYRNETPIAHECVLSWCVKTLSSSYYEGMYEERVVDTIINTTAAPFPWKTTRVSTPAGNGTLIDYTQNVTIDASINGRNGPYFGVNNDTAFATSFLFDKMFPSFYTAANESASKWLRYKVYKTNLSERRLEYNPWLFPNNVPQYLERLATAFTNELRGTKDKEDHWGSAYDEEVFVSVRLQWITLPLGLLLFSLAFLVITMVRTYTQKESIGVWKNSAIATLLYGLPDEIQKKLKSSKTETTPRARAKELKVKLLPQGWRTSGHFISPTTPKIRRYQPPPGWI
ncbi:hypothetical protein CC78DRAFT_582734 [Lojkania enalia]|uniref:DUF3176 domain containing protein n=1 Tax=Lojkania enalia TaxID=147567 RepID=A0A9P4K768_9PLEO|nr:hypothetical protein CC78DRAFT_582734 [Didymosphaeria enalia]